MVGAQPEVKGTLSIKNFDVYQHYKTRRPPWIKLYHSIWLDYPFMFLPNAAKLLYVGMLSIAPEHDNQIPWDEDYLKARLMLQNIDYSVTLQRLIDGGFLRASNSASKTLAKRKQDATPIRKRKRVRKREETTLSSDARRVLAFLNEKTGRSFEDVDSNMRLIEARLKEAGKKGWNDPVALLEGVVLRKVTEANDDPESFKPKYLRPATLFNATKFWQYAGDINKEKFNKLTEGDDDDA